MIKLGHTNLTLIVGYFNEVSGS